METKRRTAVIWAGAFFGLVLAMGTLTLRPKSANAGRVCAAGSYITQGI
jgi:hypothetical protein